MSKEIKVKINNEKSNEQELIKPFFFEDEEEPETTNNVEDQELIKPIYFEEEKKGPEDRYYLLLYYFIDDEGQESKTFDFVKGRTDTREQIIHDLAVGDLDIHKSKVLVEGAPLEDSISLYEFMKLMEVYFEDDSFDIETYNVGDTDGEENEPNFNYTNTINESSDSEEKELEAQGIQQHMLGMHGDIEETIV